MTITESLKHLQWHMWQLWRESARHNGSMDLSNSELDYLYAVMPSDGLRLTELADRMNVSKASASNMVNKLESRGYLQKRSCPEDGRASRLFLTDKTSAIKQEEEFIYTQTATALAANLTPAEMQQLSQLLAKACQHLPTD
ncbi:MAG: MarR family transcriptional regulator [Saccharospirillaceae bacterium]|nr:MarR family transcriptional regulator [Saccharospirillaceae bacterium]MCD8531815.1 MarR family transcriptional regulator [Saccharospirillaceae bacterium]